MRAQSLAATVLAAAAALALTGCGGDTQPSADKPPAAPATSSATTGGTAGSTTESTTSPSAPEALRFTGTTVDGKPFDGTSLAGKPTVLWFWAPWCPKCKAQSAETAKVAAEYVGKANVVGVAGLDKQAAMKDFVTRNKVDAFPQLSDEMGDIWKKFEVTQQSVYVVLDKDGKTTFSGSLPGGEGLADKVAKLVG
ncbi:redoxin domain-containing protein [Streptomyces sp. NPDC093546]|uniref:redoxin domain-containing protein n=1 Tax=Streptomyces sp. NPDC093546 TaxID=3366040 RepID=UPI00381472E0